MDDRRPGRRGGRPGLPEAVWRCVRHPLSRRLAAAGFLAGAGWVIWRQVSDISWSAFAGALLATPPLAIAGSLALTVGSYACLSITEWLSARSLGHAVGLGEAARIAVPAYALTNTAGFSPVTGTALRLQLYHRLGLSAKSAAAVAMVAVAAVTLSGVVELGACLALDPAAAARAVHGPAWASLLAAAVLMTPAALWFVALSPGPPAGWATPGGRC